MADEADSKSVGRKPVWVQVPLPALSYKCVKIKQSLEVTRLQGIFVYQFFKRVLSELRGF